MHKYGSRDLHKKPSASGQLPLKVPVANEDFFNLRTDETLQS